MLSKLGQQNIKNTDKMPQRGLKKDVYEKLYITGKAYFVENIYISSFLDLGIVNFFYFI